MITFLKTKNIGSISAALSGFLERLSSRMMTAGSFSKTVAGNGAY